MTFDKINTELDKKIKSLQKLLEVEKKEQTLNYKIYEQDLNDAQKLKKDINNDFDYNSSEHLYEYRFEKLNRPIL